MDYERGYLTLKLFGESRREENRSWYCIQLTDNIESLRITDNGGERLIPKQRQRQLEEEGELKIVSYDD